MSTKDNGGPAFPSTRIYMGGEQFAAGNNGMSLRDYFAAKAMPAVYSAAMVDAANGSGLFTHPDWRDGLAGDAYAMADAMLKERAK